MTHAAFGRFYADGEVIACQGEVGDCLYVVQDGEVEIVVERDGERVTVTAVLGER